MLVTDIPIWEDCPFRGSIPKKVEIRRGLNEGIDFIVFWDPETQLHVDVPAKSLSTARGRGRSLSRIKENLAYFGKNRELLKA